jgi:hypothetical protein
MVYRNATETTFSIKASFYVDAAINVTQISLGTNVTSTISENSMQYFVAYLRTEYSNLLSLQIQSTSKLELISKVTIK